MLGYNTLTSLLRHRARLALICLLIVYALTCTPTGSGSHTLHSMPLFDPNPSATRANGLNLLANAAGTLTNNSKNAALSNRSASNNGFGQGPFNPSASLPPKVVKKILDLEFVDMAEVTADDDTSQSSGRPQPRLPVTTISQWLERYSLMAAILCSRFPEKAPELFAYQSLIVRAERNYEGGRWVVYDRQFRREALARKDLDWSAPDSRLYNEAFTCRARAIPRCPFCLQDDHTGPYCPRNPNRSLFGYGWMPDAVPWPMSPGPRAFDGPRPMEVCRRFNEGRCRQASCKYRHACLSCQGPHARVNCPVNGSGRSRSPLNPPRFPGQRF